jgi:CheY-like chemotaxis protein
LWDSPAFTSLFIVKDPMQLNPHILFVDDDDDTREMVSRVLEAAGFRVSALTKAADVLTIFNQAKFDAILLDNWMPEITGIELCRRIRTFDQHTPIYFCSGAVTESEINEALKAGAQGYLWKPFDPEDLIQTLRSAVSKARSANN